MNQHFQITFFQKSIPPFSTGGRLLDTGAYSTFKVFPGRLLDAEWLFEFLRY